MMSFGTGMPAYRSQQCIEHYLPVAAAEYSEIHQFMSFEALLLDHGRYQQWIRLLAPGLLHRLLERRADEAETGVEHSFAPALVSHDYPSLCQLARDLVDGRRRCPAPQVQLRRLITNLSVSSAVHRRYEIVSYILLSWVSTEVPLASMALT